MPSQGYGWLCLKLPNSPFAGFKLDMVPINLNKMLAMLKPKHVASLWYGLDFVLLCDEPKYVLSFLQDNASRANKRRACALKAMTSSDWSGAHVSIHKLLAGGTLLMEVAGYRIERK